MIGLLSACTQESVYSDGAYSLLQKDCTETLKCGGSGIAYPMPDDLEKCIEQTGDMLNGASQNVQNMFSDKVNRCANYMSCDYTSCSQVSPNTGWSMTHQMQISNECQQTIACRIAGGMQQTMDAVLQCEAQTASMLNAQTPMVQAAFEARSQRCGGKVGCAYSACM